MNEHTIDQFPAPDRKASHRLFRFGTVALAGICGWFIFQTGGDVGIPTLLGLAILLLAAWPALRWARDACDWFPAFEISMLTSVAFYALPLLSDHTELDHYPPSVINQAGLLVVGYLLAANIGFSLVRNPPQAPTWATASLLPQSAHRFIAGGMLMNSIYLAIATFTQIIPTAFTGTFRALFFGIGILSTFILARQWGLKQLPRQRMVFITLNLFVQVVLLFSQLYLINGISLLALALIGYASARRSIPWLPVAIILPLVALLHLGKPDMRRHYWEEKRPAPTVLELPAYFAEWVGHSFSAREDKDQRTRSTIVERASLIHMLCISVDRVPSLKPYLGGESYIDIPAQIVPRFLWPGKPSSLLANVRLGLHFNLIDPDDPFAVSIAFGTVSEAYINFGVVGVLVLGFICGYCFKRITLLARGAPQFSALGVFMILLTAWSFQAELVLATWLSSLFQAAIVCIGLPLAYRKFTTR